MIKGNPNFGRQGPKLNIADMISLSYMMKKDDDNGYDEDPDVSTVNQNSKRKYHSKSPQRISFNEDIVVCRFKTDKPPSQISNKIKAFQNKTEASWVHPSLNKKQQSQQKLVSILKHDVSF